MNSTQQTITDHHQAAQQALKKGDLKGAHQHCLAVLQLDQNFADAWFLCGVIAAHNGATAKAIEILNKAIGLEPGNAEYYAELGKQLVALREPQKAIASALQALALEPAQAAILNTLGTVFSHCSEHEQALLCYERAAVALEAKGTELPRRWRAELYLNMGVSQQFSGQFEKAEAAFERAIVLTPELFKAHWALSTLQKQQADSNHLEKLEGLRSRAKSPQDQLHLGHAIAKELEDLGSFEDSMAALNWAKQRQAEELRYDTQDDAELFGTIKDIFNKELFADKKGGATDCNSNEPIFIVGMPRTGTTLVEQILGSHSNVFAAGELQSFPLTVKCMSGTASQHDLDRETLLAAVQLNLAALGDNYLLNTRPRTGQTPHFVDKLPLNFLYIGLIKLALPQAKIICLRRDPMDTCLSNYRQLLTTNSRHYLYNQNLLHCGRYFIEFERLMQHWQNILPGAVYSLNYESLTQQPEETTRGLLEYCQLDWEEQCLNSHRSTASVATPSAVQVREGIYTSSVNRWKRYGESVRPLYEFLQQAGYYQ